MKLPEEKNSLVLERDFFRLALSSLSSDCWQDLTAQKNHFCKNPFVWKRFRSFTPTIYLHVSKTKVWLRWNTSKKRMPPRFFKNCERKYIGCLFQNCFRNVSSGCFCWRFFPSSSKKSINVANKFEWSRQKTLWTKSFLKHLQAFVWLFDLWAEASELFP